MMHILPSSKIPFAKVPLDMMISTKLTYMKKRNKILKEGGKFDHGMNVPVHPNESDASLAGLILIDEYPIDHAIYQIGDGEFNTEGLQLGYKKLYRGLYSVKFRLFKSVT